MGRSVRAGEGLGDPNPFQLEGRGCVGAGELAVGQRVLRADGRWLRVEGVEVRGGAQTVYNLEVEDFVHPRPAPS